MDGSVPKVSIPPDAIVRLCTFFSLFQLLPNSQKNESSLCSLRHTLTVYDLKFVNEKSLPESFSIQHSLHCLISSVSNCLACWEISWNVHFKIRADEMKLMTTEKLNQCPFSLAVVVNGAQRLLQKLQQNSPPIFPCLPSLSASMKIHITALYNKCLALFVCKHVLDSHNLSTLTSM